MTHSSTQGQSEPAILGGVRDQHGQFWICYGTSHRHVLFSVAELQAYPNAVFTKLMGVGKRALTTKSKENLRREVEAFDRYDDRTVVCRVGWTDGSFLCADGSSFPSRIAATSALFAPSTADAKAGWSGDLLTWQNAMSGFVRHQPLVLFALSYAFAGAILAFAPPDVQNTIVELVGPPEKGKTTLGICAGSVWGGGRESVGGFGVSWNLTPGSIDKVIEARRDHLLYLEEANLAGPNDAARAELLRAMVFRITSSDPRRRLMDPSPLDAARTAVLSTSNVPLRELIGMKSDADKAALSRVLTLHVDRQFGIFDTVPMGFASASTAVQSLHRGAIGCYGVAGRDFVRQLAEWNSGRSLPTDVAESYDRYLAHPSITRLGGNRHAKILAITCVAHEIASHFCILPADWGSITAAVEALRFDVVVETLPRLSALDQLFAYVQEQSLDLVDIKALAKPLTAQEFDEASGFWIDSERLVVPKDVFHGRFPGYPAMLLELRAIECLEPEGGRTPKQSKKAPASVCVDHGRRAYFFKLPARPALRSEKTDVF